MKALWRACRGIAHRARGWRLSPGGRCPGYWCRRSRASSAARRRPAGCAGAAPPRVPPPPPRPRAFFALPSIYHLHWYQIVPYTAPSTVPIGTNTSGGKVQEEASKPVVRFREVVKTYDDDGLKVTAVHGVSLDIPRQRFAMIVGPSGSGKTTLLNLIGCIDAPSAGSVEVCERDVGSLADGVTTAFRSRNIAFVFQNFNLFPVLSAYENVEYPLLLLGVPPADRRERTLAM